jgi:hypothetical protein
MIKSKILENEAWFVFLCWPAVATLPAVLKVAEHDISRNETSGSCRFFFTFCWSLKVGVHETYIVLRSTSYFFYGLVVIGGDYGIWGGKTGNSAKIAKVWRLTDEM